MDLKDFCIDGQGHAWEAARVTCHCGDGMCCLECQECDAMDCYCENEG